MEHNTNIVRNSRELRKRMTKEERHLWYDFLRGLAYHFRRQHPVGNYVLDFYCHEAKMAIELDGSQHYEPEGLEYDQRRGKYLEKQGILVLRYSNLDVSQNFRGVCEHIELVLAQRIR